MRLSRLFEHMDPGLQAAARRSGDPEITSLHYRSQEVQPGGVFTAISGLAADGHDYIDEALARGALAVVAQRRVRDDGRIYCVRDTRRALAQMADTFFGHPSEGLTLIGVTGTNGKTTVTYLVERILGAAGCTTGVIGTINYRFKGRAFDNAVTTPESLDLQRILAEMKAGGVTHVIMEVSSHAIDMGRVAFCRFDVGAFTNLTHDHLDYHKTMEAYWECKQRFFTEHLSRGPKAGAAAAVVNADNACGGRLMESLSAFSPAVISYGSAPENAVHIDGVTMDLGGIRGTLVAPGGAVSITSRLVGRYNLENILCSAAISTALKLPAEALREGINSLDCVPGRLERVADAGGRMVFVDYAHTPDALENVLTTLRGVARQRVICVFGCGGDRDSGKRPLMGKIAGRLSDLAVVTSDNPRSEDPERIIAQIVAGLREEMPREVSPEDPAAGRGYVVIADRAEAIGVAVRVAKAGDVVLIAGKGHETYQIIGREKRDFDDRKVAAEALTSY